jgi:hypothetical protein
MSEVDRKQALADAKLLLRHAAEVGVEPQSNVACQIQVAEDANDQGKWTPQISQNFWLSYSKLCNAVKPVTAESLRASAGGSIQKALKLYRAGTIFLIVVILPLSVFLFVNTSISNEIDQMIKENDQLLLKLRELINPLSPQSVTPQRRSVTPQPQSVEESDAVTVLQQFAATTRVIYSRASLLNRWFQEHDPLAQYPEAAKKNDTRATGAASTRGHLECSGLQSTVVSKFSSICEGNTAV